MSKRQKHKAKAARQQFNYRKFLGVSRSCSHYRQPVTIGNRQILASSYYNAPMVIPDELPQPDLQVFLDAIWLEPINVPILTSGIMQAIPKSAIPIIYVPWYDGRGLPVSTLKWLIKTILDKMEQGYTVELGCLGGHGRTGTILACMVIEAEGLDPKDAINQVKEQYCQEAVETLTQVTSIYTFAGENWIRASNEWSDLKQTQSLWGSGYSVDSGW